jgi:addiction module HigA family antidote
MHEEYDRPSEALQAWLRKKNVTAYQLSKDTGLAQSRISEIIAGRRRISPETATHFGAYFGTSAEYWMSIQARHDLNESRKDGAEHQVGFGKVRFGAFICEAYVLSDEKRVISANGVLSLFGIRSSGYAYASGSKMASLLDSPFLKSEKISQLMHRVSNPIRFINHLGVVTHGFEGETVVEFCKALLEVRRVGGLPAAAKRYADMAEMIVVSLAKTGIIALIDEATGYQARRHKDALQKLFDVFLLKEYAAWAKRFPDEFYVEMFRLKSWKWESLTSQKPPVVGKITNDVVYRRIAPGVLAELQRLNPTLESGRRKVKHHQYLTYDVGHPALSQHLHTVCALMRASRDWASFHHILQLSLPMQNEGVQLEFSDLRKQ